MKALVNIRHYRFLLHVSGFVALSACATYQPQPLPEESPLAANLDVIQVTAAKLQAGAKNLHMIDPSDGLDLTEVAVIAVLANPELRAQRARLGVAGAQAFAAGVLPDPQIAASLDHPAPDGPGLVNAWSLGLSYNLTSLISHQAHLDVEQSTRSQIKLEVLWQEWQVIQRAQTLAVSYKLEAQRLALLYSMRSLYRERFNLSTQGLADGNVTMDSNGTDLTALLDSLSQISQLEQTHNQTRHDLSLLLGLRADAEFVIAELPAEKSLDKTVVQEQLKRLPEVRPDLLALQAGYQAQESRLRAAILEQFPAFNLGISRASDTSGILTSGFNIGLSLPLFDGNRGAIAIERATREQLFEEYQARRAQADNDVARLLDLQTIISNQRRSLEKYLPTLESIMLRARKAYQRGDLDALMFLNLESTWLNKRLEEISLQQNQWEIQISFQVLLALPDSILTNNTWPLLQINPSDETNHE
jgi:cobalt-zinc-cadmium efflux system outer membrane protein